MARGLALCLSLFIAIGCATQVVPPTEGPVGPTPVPASSTPTRDPATPPTPPSTTQPSPATNVVLRMTVYEPPSPATTREPPEFSLYADGRVIYVQKLADGGFELRQARLEAPGMEALSREADAALRDAQLSYDDLVAVERSTTAFDISTPELSKSVWVYALGEADDQAPSAADRARLRPLREHLLSFDNDIRGGIAVDLGQYEPEAFLVELIDAADELPDRIDWPWPTLDVDDFAQTGRRTFSRVMRPSELDDVMPVADSEYLIATAPNGGRYVIYLTPLLPGDSLA